MNSPNCQYILPLTCALFPSPCAVQKTMLWFVSFVCILHFFNLLQSAGLPLFPGSCRQPILISLAFSLFSMLFSIFLACKLTLVSSCHVNKKGKNNNNNKSDEKAAPCNETLDLSCFQQKRSKTQAEFKKEKKRKSVCLQIEQLKEKQYAMICTMKYEDGASPKSSRRGREALRSIFLTRATTQRASKEFAAIMVFSKFMCRIEKKYYQ